MVWGVIALIVVLALHLSLEVMGKELHYTVVGVRCNDVGGSRLEALHGIFYGVGALSYLEH